MKPFQVVVSVILGLFILAFLYIYIFGYKTTSTNIVQGQACKTSVELSSSMGITDIKQVQEDCPTIYIPLDTDKQSLVFETLAKSLSTTWDEFGRGEKEVFDVSKGTYCVVRRIVEFKQKETYSGFLTYLIQNSPLNEKDSYYTFLTSVPGQDAQQNIRNNPAFRALDKIDTSNSYAAVYVITKRDTVLGWLSQGISQGIGFFNGFAGYLLSPNRPTEWTAAMALIPYTAENLNKLGCTELPVAQA